MIFVEVIAAGQGLFKIPNAFQLTICITHIQSQFRSYFFGHIFQYPFHVWSIILENSRRMQTERSKQFRMLKTKLHSPTAAARETAKGTVLAVSQSSVVVIHVRDDIQNQSIAKSGPGNCIPVIVIRENNHERN